MGGFVGLLRSGVCYCVVCELMFADLQVLLVILVCLFVVLWWLVCFVVVVCLL